MELIIALLPAPPMNMRNNAVGITQAAPAKAELSSGIIIIVGYVFCIIKTEVLRVFEGSTVAFLSIYKF